MSTPSVVILPEIKLTSVCNEIIAENQVKLIDPINNQKLVYYTKQNDDYYFKSFNFFPVVLLADGSPWKHANLFLMYKLEALNTPRAKTLESTAKDLVKYKQFLDEEGLDYLGFPKRKLQRPTYRYRSYLEDSIRLGEIAKSTASRMINSMVGFYRWLEQQPDIVFDNPLWIEETFNISFKDDKGFSQSILKRSTNLRVQVPKSRNDYSNYIDDGGKLRPLDKEEQEYIVKGLSAIGNYEMTLAFLLALTTGARIQTVFTLRIQHFMLNNIDKEVRLPVGHSTGVDTKYQKKLMLFIPDWLYKKIRVYKNSERARIRREKSKLGFDDPNQQYLFLTKMGKPYYLAHDDPLASTYRNPPEGVNIRTFISQYLKPKIHELGGHFKFSFHDLRATYGMNLVEEKSKLIKEGKHTTTDVLMFVKERMGHNQITTTQRYLDYKKKYKLALHIQSSFEKHLEQIIKDDFYE